VNYQLHESEYGRHWNFFFTMAAVAVLATGMARLRLVTHLDVDAAGIDHALASMQAFAATHAERLRAQP
jgi:hypothetical protein